jgi:nucleotide-binding universal stress UspA family protein
MTGTVTLRCSRVLVALAASPQSRAAVETAIGLAAAVGARLDALYVEDANLMRLAALPFASETSALTGIRRSLPLAEIERALRVEATHLERVLAQAAGEARIEWTFQVARGELLAAATAQAAELTVLASGRRAATNGRERLPMTRPVAALFDASPAARKTLAVAAGLARAVERELLVFVPVGRGAIEAEAEARAWLAGEGISGRTLLLPPGPGPLLAALRAQRTAMLAMPAPETATLAMDLAALAADMLCPLVIVR